MFDVSGKLIDVLFNEDVHAREEQKEVFSAVDFSDGIYFYKLISSENVLTGKVILITE